jgi:hypothetical protein
VLGVERGLAWTLFPRDCGARIEILKCVPPTCFARRRFPRIVYYIFDSSIHDTTSISLLHHVYRLNRRLFINKYLTTNFHNASKESRHHREEERHCQLPPALPRYVRHHIASCVRARVHEETTRASCRAEANVYSPQT